MQNVIIVQTLQQGKPCLTTYEYKTGSQLAMLKNRGTTELCFRAPNTVFFEFNELKIFAHLGECCNLDPYHSNYVEYLYWHNCLWEVVDRLLKASETLGYIFTETALPCYLSFIIANKICIVATLFEKTAGKEFVVYKMMSLTDLRRTPARALCHHTKHVVKLGVHEMWFCLACAPAWLLRRVKKNLKYHSQAMCSYAELEDTQTIHNLLNTRIFEQYSLESTYYVKEFLPIPETNKNKGISEMFIPKIFRKNKIEDTKFKNVITEVDTPCGSYIACDTPPYR